MTKKSFFIGLVIIKVGISFNDSCKNTVMYQHSNYPPVDDDVPYSPHLPG